ncbi:MAG: transporter substrate-binding domain-containing protein [Thalassotalea sp.]|nr:transporter substrate-binding domain-containing protein [Thalassotalea sp.]
MDISAFLCKTLLVVLLLSPAYCFGESATFCYEDKNYEPYVFNYSNYENIPNGLLINIIRSAAHKANLPIKFIRRPWLRCQQMVKDNQAQALFAMIKTPVRATSFTYPTNINQALMTVEYGLFIKKTGLLDNKNTLKDITSVGNRLNLENYKKYLKLGLSAPTGYVVNDILFKHDSLSNFEYTLDEGFLAVAENRLDGYVVSKLIGFNKINEYDLSNLIYWSNIILASNDWYIPFNNEYYQLHKIQIEQFWHEISNVKDEEISQYFSEFK